MKTKRSKRNALGPSNESFIASLLASGRFSTRDDVMRAALRLLRESEKLPVLAKLKPFTREEARQAFAPDNDWDALESQAVRNPRTAPPEFD